MSIYIKKAGLISDRLFYHCEITINMSTNRVPYSGYRF